MHSGSNDTVVRNGIFIVQTSENLDIRMRRKRARYREDFEADCAPQYASDKDLGEGRGGNKRWARQRRRLICIHAGWPEDFMHEATQA